MLHLFTLVAILVFVGDAAARRIEVRGRQGELIETIPRMLPGLEQEEPQFTWTKQNVERGGCLMDVSMAPNGKNGLAAEDGENWRVTMGTSFPYYWYGAHTFNDTHGFVSGFINPCTTNCGVIRWTTDGGKVRSASYRPVVSIATTQTWSADMRVADPWLGGPIEFADRNNGFMPQASGSNGFRTSDGGKTWTQVVINKDAGWVAGNYRFVRNQPLFITGVQFCSSKDGGFNFTCGKSVDEIFDGGVYFPSPSTGFTGGGSIMPDVRGWVHRSQNGGASWSGRLIQTPFPVRVVSFVNDTLGFAAGGNVFSGVGGIYSTIDGGTTWKLEVNTGVEVHGVTFVRLRDPNRVQVWMAACGQPAGGIWTATIPLG